MKVTSNSNTVQENQEGIGSVFYKLGSFIWSASGLARVAQTKDYAVKYKDIFHYLMYNVDPKTLNALRRVSTALRKASITPCNGRSISPLAFKAARTLSYWNLSPPHWAITYKTNEFAKKHTQINIKLRAWELTKDLSEIFNKAYTGRMNLYISLYSLDGIEEIKKQSPEFKKLIKCLDFSGLKNAPSQQEFDSVLTYFSENPKTYSNLDTVELYRIGYSDKLTLSKFRFIRELKGNFIFGELTVSDLPFLSAITVKHAPLNPRKSGGKITLSNLPQLKIFSMPNIEIGFSSGIWYGELTMSNLPSLKTARTTFNKLVASGVPETTGIRANLDLDNLRKPSTSLLAFETTNLSLAIRYIKNFKEFFLNNKLNAEQKTLLKRISSIEFDSTIYDSNKQEFNAILSHISRNRKDYPSLKQVRLWSSWNCANRNLPNLDSSIAFEVKFITIDGELHLSDQSCPEKFKVNKMHDNSKLSLSKLPSLQSLTVGEIHRYATLRLSDLDYLSELVIGKVDKDAKIIVSADIYQRFLEVFVNLNLKENQLEITPSMWIPSSWVGLNYNALAKDFVLLILLWCLALSTVYCITDLTRSSNDY